MTELIGHVENPSAKVQFTKITHTAPGCCAICGSGQDNSGFVDSGLDFEFWGRVYFCCQCTLEIAAVFGFISPADYADLEAELDSTKFNLKNMTEKTEHLEKALAGLLDIRNHLDINSPESLPAVEVPTTSTPNEITADESINSPSGEAEPQSTPSNKPTSGQSGSIAKSASKPGLLNI